MYFCASKQNVLSTEYIWWRWFDCMVVLNNHRYKFGQKLPWLPATTPAYLLNSSLSGPLACSRLPGLCGLGDKDIFRTYSFSFPMGTALRHCSTAWLAFQNFGAHSSQEHHQIPSWWNSLSGGVHLLQQRLHLPEVGRGCSPNSPLPTAPDPEPCLCGFALLLFWFGALSMLYTVKETSRTWVPASEVWMCF